MPLQGMILWVPMLQGDGSAAAQRQADAWPEERVQHWWDGEKRLSGLVQHALGLTGPAWDVYLLYPPGLRWKSEVPPAPAFWMHQLTDPAAAEERLLCREPSRLAHELERLLRE